MKVLQYLCIKPCMDDFANTVKEGTLILISKEHKHGYSKNLDNVCTHNQLKNKDFFLEVPAPSEENGTTVTVVITGKTAYMNRTYTLKPEDVGEKVYNLMEYIKQLEGELQVGS